MSSTPADHEEAIRVMQAAGAQIELALHQSQAPIDSLGESLRRLAALLADPAQLARPEALALMRADLLRAITNLQFHDRMTQHLQHVRDYLSGSAAHMAEQDADEEACATCTTGCTTACCRKPSACTWARISCWA